MVLGLVHDHVALCFVSNSSSLKNAEAFGSGLPASCGRAELFGTLAQPKSQHVSKAVESSFLYKLIQTTN